MLFQGQEIGRAPAVALLRRSRRGALARPCARAAPSSSRSSRGSRPPRRRPRSPIPCARRDVPRVRARARRAPARRADRRAPPRSAPRSGATTRRSPRSRPTGSTAPCSRRTRSCCAGSSDPPAGDRLLLVNLGPTFVAARRARAAARAAARPGLAHRVVERGPALRRLTARRRCSPSSGSHMPARAAVLLAPDPAGGLRASRARERARCTTRVRTTSPTDPPCAAPTDRAPTAASGSSPTASAATRRARSAACRRGATTACSIAALPNPAGRVMMLNSLAEQRPAPRPARASISAGSRRPARPRRARRARRVPARARAAGVAVRGRTASRSSAGS